MNGWIDRCVGDGWMNVCMHLCVHICLYVGIYVSMCVYKVKVFGL